MALNTEVIKGSDVLKGLTDDQVKEIVTLSTNDEQIVIGKKIGEVHGKYDEDIKALTGLDKNSGEKTYAYLKRAVKEKMPDVSKLKETIETQKTAIADLTKKIKDGSADETLKSKLVDAEKTLETLRTQMTEKETEHANKLKEMEAEVSSQLFEAHLESEVSKLVFKPDTDDAVKAAMVSVAKDYIKGQYTTDTDGNGNVIYKDKDGNLARNKDNKSFPFTTEELLTSKLGPIIGESKPGGGTGAGGKRSSGGSIDLSSATSQVEAEDMIRESLMKKGITTTDPKMAEEVSRIRKENDFIDALPMQ